MQKIAGNFKNKSILSVKQFTKDDIDILKEKMSLIK